MSAQTYSTISPYLMVHDGAAALKWYAEVFHAECTESYPHEGKLGHATLRVNGATFFLSDEFPDIVARTGTQAPRSLGGTTVTVSLEVDDVDTWHTRAVSAGAEALREPNDEFYGRMSKIRDPFGHVWAFGGPKKG